MLDSNAHAQWLAESSTKAVGGGWASLVSAPTLPSPVIGRCPAVFAPTRCIVGIVSGSVTTVLLVVLLGAVEEPPVLSCCCWSTGPSRVREFGLFKLVAGSATVLSGGCGAKSRRIRSRGGWRRVRSAGVWRRCARSWTWTSRRPPRPWRTSRPSGTRTPWRWGECCGRERSPDLLFHVEMKYLASNYRRNQAELRCILGRKHGALG